MSPYNALGKSRHPFEIFALSLAFITGFPLLFGDAKPGSISDPLNPVLENIWGITLSLGAGIALAGVLWSNRINGILIEQVGLVMTGFAVLFYAIAIILSIKSLDAAVPVALVSSFGASCVWRYFQLEKLIRRARKQVRLIARDIERL